MDRDIVKIQTQTFGGHHKRRLDQGEEIIVEWRIFGMPTMGKSMFDSITDMIGKNLIRKPALITRQPEPNPGGIQDQTEEKDEQDL